MVDSRRPRGEAFRVSFGLVKVVLSGATHKARGALHARHALVRLEALGMRCGLRRPILALALGVHMLPHRRGCAQFSAPREAEGTTNGENMPLRAITQLRQDDLGDWIAELSCGHSQHVRHDPPWQVRAWTQTAEGRASRIGTPLDCPICGPSVDP